MNRKDKTVKQLQAECRRRKIGFMMTWTKPALVKRLEDEDKRELATKKIEEDAINEVNKATKELKDIKAKAEKKVKEVTQKHVDYVALRDEQYDEHLRQIQSMDKEVIQEKAFEEILEKKDKRLKYLKEQWDKKTVEQNAANKLVVEIGEAKKKIFTEMEAIEIFKKSLI